METLMSLDQEAVKRIARLARLKLSEDRLEPMLQDLNRILHFIEQLNEVDTSGVEPMVGVETQAMPMRKDAINDGNYVQKILANAPEVACNMFVVPKVVE
jgi:aspartyl-tRNA(Asn)/glutamyl-tRNA(Gln) amidotransferase subunit C